MIDFGTKATRALDVYGMKMKEIDNVIITHFHADHIGGLEEMALMTKYFLKKRINLYLREDMVDALWEHSLKGGLQYTGVLDVPHADLGFYFNVIPVKDKFILDGVEFNLIPTYHVKGMKSFGLCFNNILFTGDTQFDKDLLHHSLDKYCTIFHDCDFTKNPVHTYYEDLLTVPKEKRHKIYLMHYSDIYKKFEKQVKNDGFKMACQQKIIKV